MEIFIRIFTGFLVFCVVLIGFGWMTIGMDENEGSRAFMILLIIAIIAGVLFGCTADIVIPTWETFWKIK